MASNVRQSLLHGDVEEVRRQLHRFNVKHDKDGDYIDNGGVVNRGRGLHSSTFRLNLSHFVTKPSHKSRKMCLR